MLNALKALKTTIANKNESYDYLPYTEFFSNDFLSDLYVLFKNHINADAEKNDFKRVIIEELLSTREGENVKKIQQNLKVEMTDEMNATFLENLCYLTWFPQMKMAGHAFNEAEKLALAGYGVHSDCKGDPEYPFKNIDAQVAELKTSCSSRFIDVIFEVNLEHSVARYSEFNNKACPA
jgi:hypothetical protein